MYIFFPLCSHQLTRWLLWSRGRPAEPFTPRINHVLLIICLLADGKITRLINPSCTVSLCYLVIYCSLSHVSCHKPDCGRLRDGERGAESSGKRVRQCELWRRSFNGQLCFPFFFVKWLWRPISPFTADISFSLSCMLKTHALKSFRIFRHTDKKKKVTKVRVKKHLISEIWAWVIHCAAFKRKLKKWLTTSVSV